jgi:hypothetical protein
MISTASAEKQLTVWTVSPKEEKLILNHPIMQQIDISE